MTVHEKKHLKNLNLLLFALNVGLAFWLAYRSEWQKLFVFPIFFITIPGLIEATFLYKKLVKKIQSFTKLNIYAISNYVLLLCLGAQFALLFQPCDPNELICPKPHPPTSTAIVAAPTDTPALTPFERSLSMSLVNAQTNLPHLPRQGNAGYFAANIVCSTTTNSFESVLIGRLDNLYNIDKTNNSNITADVVVVGVENTQHPSRFLVRTNHAHSIFQFVDRSPAANSTCYFWLLQPSTGGLLSPVERLQAVVDQFHLYECQDIAGNEFCP